MGDTKRVDIKHNKVILYCSQSDDVVSNLMSQGIHYAKIAFIREKYAEASGVFLSAYSWYVQNAGYLIPKPDDAESGIWAYPDIAMLDRHEGSSILELEVPLSEVLFFLISDWNKVLNMRYMGRNEEGETRFKEKLDRYGIGYEGDVFLKPFYPSLKKEVIQSWNALFRFDEKIKNGETQNLPHIQAGLWKIEKDWVLSTGR